MNARILARAFEGALLFSMFALFGSVRLQGSTFLVTSQSDTLGPGTLRGAVILANQQPGLDTILLPAGEFHLSKEGAPDDRAEFGDLDLTDDVSIRGKGAGFTVIYAGELDFALRPDRVFQIHPGVSATIQSLTIAGGGSLDFKEDGGGIHNTGSLTLIDVLVTKNTLGEGAGRGAGIFNSGSLTILRSTVSYNESDVPGGGVFNIGSARIESSAVVQNFSLVAGGGIANGGQLVLVSTTIGQNGVENDGGGIYSDGDLRLEHCTVVDNGTATTSGGHRGGGLASFGPTRMHNTVIARNIAGGDNECTGSIESLGYNFIGDTTACSMTLRSTDRTGDPLLGGLSTLGQPGLAHFPPLQGSPLIDAADPASCPPLDQLGDLPDDGDGDGKVICDIGAVERQTGCGGEIVLEVGGAGPRFTGTWALSNAPLAHGGVSYWSRAASATVPSVILESEIAPGLYELLEWHTVWATRTKAAPHTIEHAAGRTEIAVDQSVGGGRWNSLGTFAFGGREPGLEVLARVIISARDPILSTNADAIRIVCKSVDLPRAIIDSWPQFTALQGEVVCFRGHGESTFSITDGEWESSLQGHLGSGLGICTEQLEPGFHTIAFRVRDASGLWSERVVVQVAVQPSECAIDIQLAAGGGGTFPFAGWYPSAAPNAFGGTSFWSRYKGSGPVPSYTFTADLPPGDYEVLEWHTTWTTRSRDAHHVIQHASGSSSVSVNQSVLGGRWNSLGTYTFSGRSSVMIFATDPERSTNANGIRFRCRP